MRRSVLTLGVVGVVALAASLALAVPSGDVAAQQQPSPRPPLSSTDQYLTSVAPQPTQPGSGGGGGSGPGATAVAVSPTPTRPRATRTATPTATATATETAIPPTVTPPASSTPVLIVQTVVQTVVVVATDRPTATATLMPVSTGTVAADPQGPGAWLWLVILLPFLALLVALWWLMRRDFVLPGFYPLRGRPRSAGRLPGRRPRNRMKEP